MYCLHPRYRKSTVCEAVGRVYAGEAILPQFPLFLLSLSVQPFYGILEIAPGLKAAGKKPNPHNAALPQA
ncbi:MAG: hypothetical protein WA946_07985 [Nitrospirota bacterium]